jgi:hypothetical protein
MIFLRLYMHMKMREGWKIAKNAFAECVHCISKLDYTFPLFLLAEETLI